jgi:hypothetical protein
VDSQEALLFAGTKPKGAHMTDLPVISNGKSARSGKKADSVFKSAGQTKQFPPRPRITTAKPHAGTKPTGGKA